MKKVTKNNNNSVAQMDNSTGEDNIEVEDGD